MTTCDVCGTSNDSKLTFCRNCGHRLNSNKSRAVPPTPATAASKVALPTKGPKDGIAGEPGEEAAASRSRPAAPPIVFGAANRDSGRSAPGTRPAAPPPEAPASPPAAALPADKTQCAQCGALSPKNYRFCISCGAVLEKPAPGSSQRAEPMAKPAGTRQPRAVRASGARGPSGPAEAAPAGETDCARCGGRCRVGEVFCKHCGAPLDGEAVSPPARQAQGLHAQPRGADEQAARPQPAAAEPAAPVALSHKAAGDGEPFPLAESAVQNQQPVRTVERRRPAPQPEITGQLVVIVEDGSEGKAIGLQGRQLDIGSVHGDIVLSEDRYLSPRHARFFRQGGGWYLRDLGSVNGVYRRLREPVQLQDGDLVLLGLEVLQFDLVDHAERGLGHAIQHGVLVFGSPATPRRARLCQRTVEGVIRDVYHLVADETTIGREMGDIVFTSDPFMSRRHATIVCDDESQEYILSDLSSSNGTYLAIRDDVRLDDGDFIRLGQHLFRVDLPPRRKAR